MHHTTIDNRSPRATIPGFYSGEICYGEHLFLAGYFLRGGVRSPKLGPNYFALFFSLQSFRFMPNVIKLSLGKLSYWFTFCE